MNHKIKLALIYRLYNQGFAVPLAMLLGMTMVLLGVTMFARSQNDNSKVLAQKAKMESLNIAEVAVTRIQDLVSNHPIIAMYPSCNNSDPTSNICDNNSWANADASPILSNNLQVCQGNGTTVDASPQISNMANTQWQRINPNDVNDSGEYRLLAYQYSPTVGQVPGTGSLLIEGRQGVDKGQSTTRLVVRIPVTERTTNVPGIWIRKGGIANNNENMTDSGTNKQFAADIWLNDCNVPNAVVNSIQANNISGSHTVQRMNVQPPTRADLPAIPSGIPEITLNSNVNFPRTGDIANANGVYEYRVNFIDLRGNEEVIITPGSKVTFYVLGDIQEVGNGGIRHDCSTAPTETTCKPGDFKIYGYGDGGTAYNVTINGNTVSGRGNICLKGGRTMQAFVIAPTYNAGAVGGGDFQGSIWANTWGKVGNCISNNPNQVVQVPNPHLSWEDLPANLKPTIPPQIGQVSCWVQQSTNQNQTVCPNFSVSPSPSPSNSPISSPPP
jgi:hypothetical protein